MNNISYLQNHLQVVKRIYEQQQSKLAHDNKFSYQVAVASTEKRIKELEHKLALAIKNQQQELLEIRLIGNNFHGNVELDILTKLMGSFNKVIGYAVDKYKKPNKKSNKINKAVEMKLEGIALGSCKLYVSGSSNDDMFLFHNVMENIFDLLNHDMNKPLTEIINKIGRESVHCMGLFIKEINKNDINLDLKLLSTDGKYSWIGNKPRLHLLQKFIETANLSENKININGVITMISKYGKLDIEHTDSNTLEKKRFSVKYSKDQFAEISHLKIDSKVSAKLLEKVSHNDVTLEESRNYSLIEFTV